MRVSASQKFNSLGHRMKTSIKKIAFRVVECNVICVYYLWCTVDSPQQQLCPLYGNVASMHDRTHIKTLSNPPMNVTVFYNRTSNADFQLVCSFPTVLAVWVSPRKPTRNTRSSSPTDSPRRTMNINNIVADHRTFLPSSRTGETVATLEAGTTGNDLLNWAFAHSL